jgi:hypothetical protein
LFAAVVCTATFSVRGETTAAPITQPSFDAKDGGTAATLRRDLTILQFQHTSWTVKEGAPSPIYDLVQ